jgi:hypothetical protein
MREEIRLITLARARTGIFNCDRKIRHQTNDASCRLCGAEFETLEHLLTDCRELLELQQSWQATRSEMRIPSFFTHTEIILDSSSLPRMPKRERKKLDKARKITLRTAVSRLPMPTNP